MLLQELSQPSDFVKIDSPECIETRGLINGENAFACFSTPFINLGTTPWICIKPLSVDTIVSNHIRIYGAWEPKYVNSVLKMVQRFPEATFLGSTKFLTTIYINNLTT